MLGIVRNIFGGRKNISGAWLTKEDMQKLREAATRKMSPLRKELYKTWDCTKCSSSYFYAVIRCPSCESLSIEEQMHPLKETGSGYFLAKKGKSSRMMEMPLHDEELGVRR